MITTGNLLINIYTEVTPNPETLKFVVNKLLYPSKSVEITRTKNKNVSPLAEQLFTFPFVEGVFIASNFITITKKTDAHWESITNPLKETIKQYVEEGKNIILEENLATEEANPTSSKNEAVVISKIQEVLENYVKPAVEMDGGAIQLKKYENGKVYVTLQGSCSGCPSSTITLKAGIETMMKRMIPEVKEVIAE